MKDALTPGQYQDWVQYATQFNISPEKEDIFWAIALSDYRNAHASETSPESHPSDFLPWRDPFQDDPEDMTVEDLLRECGLR